jgi:hypothetical protein
MDIARQTHPLSKKLPVQLDIPELLVMNAYSSNETQKSKATADLAMIAFYYLLRVVEYMVKAPATQPSRLYNSNMRHSLFQQK